MCQTATWRRGCSPNNALGARDDKWWASKAVRCRASSKSGNLFPLDGKARDVRVSTWASPAHAHAAKLQPPIARGFSRRASPFGVVERDDF